jgi:hypothetical protein
MTKTPSKKRKKAAQKAIAAKTDREMMEAIFGKRVMREVHKHPALTAENREVSESMGR